MIYDWSREQARRNGSQIAVTFFDEHLTYEALEIESNKLAGKLIAEGLKPGDRVGLFLEKNPKTIIAMLGVSKAGGDYVPLDYNSPAERVLKIIKSSDLSIIFIDQASIHAFQDLLYLDHSLSFTPWVWWSNAAKLFADDNAPRFSYSDIENEQDIAHQVDRNLHSPAHILFTSGSTGQPKGVVITHKNIEAFINWAVPFFNMKPGEHTSCHSPLHFDLSTFDIYGAFASGSHLYLVPASMSVNPKKLSDFIFENELDQWFSVPSALSYMARFHAIPENRYPSLKRLIWCGEVFPVPALQYWMRNLPKVQFTNLYGPTEATIASSYYTIPEVPDDLAEIPIGKACDGETLLVLDENLNSVAPGVIGDLYIAGEGLSPGYWRDEEKTNSVFIWYTSNEGKRERIYKTGDLASLNKDGMVCFHGRSDYQIKSRGYRIELGEIEAALGQNDLLKEYAVVPVRKNGFEGTSIGCAFVVGGTENGDVSSEIKKQLSSKVPAYMIPQFWQKYEKLPRNGNGKIDRRTLADNFED